jgi:alanine dehydrogenase
MGYMEERIMNIGIPKERRPYEFRVGLSPAGVELLCQRGHTIYVEHEAGAGAGFSDQEYESAGARIAYSTEEVFMRADLLLKVTRPTQGELDHMRPGTALAGLLHLASARKERVETLLAKKITALAYEQIRETDGSLPVLRPFSQIGGVMAAEVAARLLQSDQGGKGVLLGGIPGVPPAEVVIIDAGVVGTFALRAFAGLGAHVTMLDKDLKALQRVSDCSYSPVTMLATQRNIERACAYADVVVGAVLVPGERSPIVVQREMVQKMKPRSVIIDVSIDQGGCIETSRPTTHDQPTYVEEGIIHYCVPNIPSVVARAATHAFVNAVMDYLFELADHGVDAAIASNSALAAAVNTQAGELRNLTLLTGGGYGLE